MNGKLLMSLILALAMVFVTVVPSGVGASEPMDCASMMADMGGKMAPDAPKVPSCIDKAGCLLFCAKLPVPTSVSLVTEWTKNDFTIVDVGQLKSVDDKPDHSPPKFTA